MSLLAMRTSIINALKAALPDLKGNCLPHGGRFDKGSLKQLALKSPALLVACLGLVEAREDSGGAVEATFAWGAFVVTTDKPQLPRDAGALAIMTVLSLKVPGNKWGRGDVDYPGKVRGDNLFSGAIDGAGVALWAVTWQQTITIGGLDPATLDAFLTMHVDYDLAPMDGTIEASDDIQLPQT